SESGKGGRARGRRGTSIAGESVGSALATRRRPIGLSRPSWIGSTSASTPPSSPSKKPGQPRPEPTTCKIERLAARGRLVDEKPPVREHPIGPVHLPVHLRTEEIEDGNPPLDTVGEHVLHEELAGRAGAQALVVRRLG